IRPLRRAIREARLVPDGEVRRLQARGSAQLMAYLRGQILGAGDRSGIADAGRSLGGAMWAAEGRGALLGWAALAIVFLVGSRRLITGGVAAVGGLVPFPSVGVLWHHATAGWRSAGLGSPAPPPTAFSLVWLLGTVLGGAMGAARTLLVLGAWPLGALGVWRLTSPLGSKRVQILSVAVYASVPLPYDALATGRWPALFAYASTPWILARLARATGLEPFGAVATTPPIAAGATPPPIATPAPIVTGSDAAGGRRLALHEILGLGVVLALAAAFAPGIVLVALVLAVGMLGGSLVAGGRLAAWRGLRLAVGSVVAAAVLLIPWSATFMGGRAWSALTGPGGGALGHASGLGALIRFQTGPLGASPLGWVFLVAAALPLVVGGGWRWAWAVRLWSVALLSFGVTWAVGRGWIASGTDRPEVLLAPAAVALAVSIGLGLSAFELDLPGYRFGWRQVASAAAAAAVVLGTLPVLGAAAGGRWEQPSLDLVRSLSWMPAQARSGRGAFRVLWVGDPAVLPLDGWRLQDGLAYASSLNGPPQLTDQWAPSEPGVSGRLGRALRIAIRGDTTRLGRLLAPLGVRYVVVPERLGPARSGSPRRSPPLVLSRALEVQADMRPVPTDPALAVYENADWGPLVAGLTPDSSVDPSSAAARRRGADLSGAIGLFGPTPFPLGVRGHLPGPASGTSSGASGVDRILLSEASSSHWRLHVAGQRGSAPRSTSFGWANRFAVDPAQTGTAVRLGFATPPGRRLLLVAQLGLWLWVLAILWVGRRRHLRHTAESARSGPEAEGAAAGGPVPIGGLIG
ncbi:MAG: hypothetical protein ACYDAD_08995, partial [Acidimicrobiales bacterium]